VLTGPLAELLGLSDGDEVDALLGAQSLDELLVVGLVAVVGEHAELRLAALNGARRLVQAAREAVVRERLLKDDLDRGVDVHGLAGGGDGRRGGRLWAVPSAGGGERRRGEVWCRRPRCSTQSL
jgi:hypothetical protein